MNIKDSKLNFERGEIVAAARAYFTVKDMNARITERNIIEHDFRRLLANATQDSSTAMSMDSRHMTFLAQIVTLMACGNIMTD